MTGFWVLAKKELLEQRRTWRFPALAGVFCALALLISVIAFIVTEVHGEAQDARQALNLLEAFSSTTVSLGTLVVIIVAMGALAGERSSGTAAMTLSKPVTRAAFVASKFAGLVGSIVLSLAIASMLMFALTSILFDIVSAGRFAVLMAVVGVYLIFIGSISFFWSGVFSRPLLAGGIALFVFIALVILMTIPHTERYWPPRAIEWGTHFLDKEARELEAEEDVFQDAAQLALTTGEILVQRADLLPSDLTQELEVDLNTLEAMLASRDLEGTRIAATELSVAFGLAFEGGQARPTPDFFREDSFGPDRRSAYWSAFAVAGGSAGLLAIGAWAAFRRKEL